METYLPITEAAEKLNITKTYINKLVSSGTIEAINYSGVKLVSMDKLSAQLPKQDRPEYKKYEHLSASGISVNQAGRKYKIPGATISRWTKAGFIKILATKKNRLLLSEQDVAYCAEIYHNKNGGQGKWLFKPDGTPYQYKD